MSQYCITIEEKNKTAYFTVRWSPFIRLDKRRVRSLIPAEAGIFQVYMISAASLELTGTHKTYFGGLRASFLEILDEDCQVAFPNKELLRESECYIRYTVSSSRDDLDDVMHHFTGSDDTGRFAQILVEEKECKKIAR